MQHLICDEANITIEAKENWDKMRFQLRYYFADDLIDLSRDTLKTILDSDDNSLPWDSLLYDQRQSIVNINYLGTVQDRSDRKKILELNLRSAIYAQDFDLANKVLFEMYDDDIYLPDLLVEDFIHTAFMTEPALTQNAAAILSRNFGFNKIKTTEFLFNWLKADSLSLDVKHNLLHLYTLVSNNLVHIWDLPSKRLSNVIHPLTFESWLSENLQRELMLNLNIVFINYYGQVNDSRNIEKSFNFIANYFKVRALDIKDEISLVLFFNNWSRYDLTINQLGSKFKEGKLNEDAIFILMKTLSFYEVGKKYGDIYQDINLDAIKLNRLKWCYWIATDYQKLRDGKIKSLYCQNCTKDILLEY